ncbi:MBL fold metallo-hydrolase [Bacteroidales bacterium OttesenSCG-928-M11]|nr:MBL fold metallo-hydrolase [Bacteroidales bacterium OttesenSCG-928-M11]
MIQYHILETGFFYADGGAMFGAIPKRAWKRKIIADEENRCLMSMNCLLVQIDDRILLFDTGIGSKDLKKLSYYNFQKVKDIRTFIEEINIKPEDITDVILSHLHFDHCGGCTYRDNSGNLQIAFPNAKHYVGAKQWQNFLNPNDLERDSFRKEDILPIEEKGLLHLIEEDIELLPGVEIKLYDGHTYNQLAAYININNNEWLIFPSDVIPTRAHLSDEWISAYDIEPLKSLESKRKIKEWAKDKKHKYIFYHSS